MAIRKDLTGMVFGRLTVIKYSYTNTNRHSVWECDCECGNTVLILGSSLLVGDTISCGCYRKEMLIERLRKDLTGEVFGYLTVLEFSHSTKKGVVFWICKCRCGNMTSVRSGDLSSGHIKSCGCYQKERAREYQFVDLTGKRFGRLVAIEVSEIKNNLFYWRCICDCGKECDIVGKSLSNGNTKSCGCYQKEKMKERFFVDLTGKRFGHLLVLKLIEKNKRGYIYECLCDCGKKVNKVGEQLSGGNTISCGCLTESTISSELKKHYEELYLAVPEYNELRNPKTNHFLPYDIFIPQYNTYIEIQGVQHYMFVEFWHKTLEQFEYNRHLDNLKKQYALENGVFIEVDLRKITTTQDAIDYIDSILKIESQDVIERWQ